MIPRPGLLRRIGFVASAIVVASWLGAIAYLIVEALRMRPGWSLLPVNGVLVTVLAAVAAACIWGLLIGADWILATNRDRRRSMNATPNVEEPHSDVW